MAPRTKSVSDDAPAVPSIRPELAHLDPVPVGKLKPHPKNARRHDADRIQRSLALHGQYAPVVVQRSRGRVIKGHGTWTAAKALGMPNVAVQYLDVDDAEALRILADDNRSSDDAGYEGELLAKMLSDLGRSFSLDEDTLWSQAELDRQLRSLDRLSEDLAAGDLGGIGERSTEGATNPLDAPDPPSHPDSTAVLTFVLTPEERSEVRTVLGTVAGAIGGNTTDALMAVIRAYKP